jgi:hypothetical protein
MLPACWSITVFYSMLTDTGKNHELHYTRMLWELHPHRNLWKKHWRGTNFSVPRGGKTSHWKSYICKSFDFCIYSAPFEISLEYQDVINRVTLGPCSQLLQRYSGKPWKSKENSWLSKRMLFDYIISHMEIVITYLLMTVAVRNYVINFLFKILLFHDRIWYFCTPSGLFSMRKLYCNVEQYHYYRDPFTYIKTNTKHLNSTHI